MTTHIGRGVREGALFILLAIAVYLFIALLSFDPADPGWSQSGGSGEITNRGGVAGAWFADVFLYLFGYLAYLLPIMVAYSGWLIYSGSKDQVASFDINELWLRAGGFVLALTAGAGLASMRFGMLDGQLPHDRGARPWRHGRGLAGRAPHAGAARRHRPRRAGRARRREPFR